MKELNKDITAFIMAGGKSKRFGQNKLLFEYRGAKLIELVANVLKGVFERIKIIADDRDNFSFLGFPVIPDMVRKAGPIGGIYTALNHTETRRIFCVAADMPELNAGFIHYMISEAGKYDIVVPHYRGMYESLHAVYSRKCIRKIEGCISSGNFQITGFYEGCNIKFIEESEINKFGTPEKIFRNINYMKDIE